MTRTANARIAGFTFLFYIAAGLSGMVLSQGRTTVLLAPLQWFAALVLAVTLYGITRDVDHELALLALTCRVAEGVFGAIHTLASLAQRWLSTAGAGTGAPDASAAQALGALLLKVGGWSTIIGATFFAVGSTLFSYLFLCGRMIPVALAWLGVVASIVLVVGLPMQLAGFLTGPVTSYMWLPMLAFEVPLGLWLLIKGVAIPKSSLRN